MHRAGAISHPIVNLFFCYFQVHHHYAESFVLSAAIASLQKLTSVLLVSIYGHYYYSLRLCCALERLKQAVSNYFIDFWTEVREWSLKSVFRLGTTSKQLGR